MVDKNRLKQLAEGGLNVYFFGKHFEITDPLKNYIFDKLDKLDRFHPHAIDLHVTLEVQKLEQMVTILMKFSHFKIKVQASSTDMYASIDKAIDRMQTKLRKWKSRIQDHHKRSLSVVDMRVNVLERPYSELEEINAEIAAAEKSAKEYFPARIIGTEMKPLKTLKPEEAVMKMELSDDNFLIYRDEVDRKLKVIYRRTDGNYGLILPE